MTNRLKRLIFALMLLLVVVSGWAAHRRSQRTAWVDSVRELGVEVTCESNFEGSVDSPIDLMNCVWAGECVRVNVANEADARALLKAARYCPGRLEILTLIDLSAECFFGIEERFPDANIFALMTEEQYRNAAPVIPPAKAPRHAHTAYPDDADAEAGNMTT